MGKCYIETCLDNSKRDSECWDCVRQWEMLRW